MYSCLEHIEESMDHFLDEHGKLPILVEVEIEHRCHHCENAAVYKIIEGMMIDEDDSF
ncbi:CxxH/CxxC protein [Turicibacter sp. TJ11]|uniref:CxxH/CxxC protein n=1 Tax=Turicibacter sp. TJ11 TaxID=2806443 RepID=UPI001F36E89E|nr:CxxH/CxxC protein [Turicibacter sp. TJ11]